ncbi:MAG: BamA/TamA family outer membrane protein, partial [Pirellulales bacterium]|nr:BamA/TamA family outer membrane protein [Pirellulales bacterium]
IGNETTTSAQVASHISTRAGRPFDQALVQRDVRQLANLGWFVDVKALHESTPQGRIVIFRVVERPTIRYVTYLGAEKIKPKTLAKQTGLKAGGSVDPYAVEDGRRKLRDYYTSKGYNNVQITILEGNKATDQGVVYLINEGVTQRIWKNEFIGNDSGFVSDGRLKTLIKSKPPILYIFKGYLDRERIEADKEAITAYYRAHGFFQAKVSRILYENDKGNWITLKFIIHEGQRYNVRNVTVLGNTKFEPAPLQEKLKLQSGQPFEQAKMQADAQWLQDLYGSQGYVFAAVEPETVYLEQPGQVDLVYHIEEGKRWQVGRIFVHIAGDNPHTRIQTMLNRVTLRPGQIMDIRELRASERRLMASSLFAYDPASGQKPKITYRIPDDADLGLAAEPTGRKIRGQSPEPAGPPVLPPPGYAASAAGMVTPANAPAPTKAVASPDGVDLHVYCDDEQHYRRWQEAEQRPDDSADANRYRPQPPAEAPQAPAPSALPQQAPQPPPIVVRGQSPEPTAAPAGLSWVRPRQSPPREYLVERPPAISHPYDELRGQSPDGGSVNQAYATAAGPQPANPTAARAPLENGYVNRAYATLQPAAAPSSNPYGGQVVHATGPEDAPTSVQPAQYSPYSGYSQNLQPPAGSIYPTPLSPQGPMPGYSVDPTSPLYAAPNVLTEPVGAVDIHVEGAETQTGRLMVGVGVNSDAGVIGNIVIDERNFDWTRLPTSWEDVRNGSAWRGAGQRFRIDASPGSQVSRYLVSFQEPYLFDEPISLGLSGSYYTRQFADWSEQRLGGRVSLGQQWVERDLSATITYRGENVEIFNPSVPRGVVPDLDRALGDNVLHGFRAAVINDTRDSAFLATQGHYFEVGGEQVIGSFDYPRVDLDFRQYWMLYERPDHSGRHVLSYSTSLGYSGTHTPIYENFFAGGFATMRGFDFRQASPVEDGVIVGGRFQWLNTLQYLFPITADDMLHGVAFCDFGTVERDVEINDFRVAPGVGLRITVPAMGPAPIALDFAFPVSYADFDDRQVFSFSLGFSR